MGSAERGVRGGGMNKRVRDYAVAKVKDAIECSKGIAKNRHPPPSRWRVAHLVAPGQNASMRQGSLDLNGKRLAVAFVLVLSSCFEDSGSASSGGTTDDDTETTLGTTAGTTITSNGASATWLTTAESTGTSADSAADVTTDGTADGGSSTGTTGPTGCQCETGHCDADGNCARLIFVTAGAHGAVTLDGVAGADSICNSEASAAGFDSEFRAVIRETAGGNEAPFLHTGLDLPGFVYLRTDGARIADNESLLRPDNNPTAELANPIDHDAQGNQVTPSSTCGQPTRVWTGLRSDNTPALSPSPPTCMNWASGADNGGVGIMDETDLRWAGAQANCACNRVAHLYCVEMPP